MNNETEVQKNNTLDIGLKYIFIENKTQRP